MFIRVIFTFIIFIAFNVVTYGNYVCVASQIKNSSIIKNSDETKQQKEYKKQVYKKNKKIAKQVIKANKQQCKDNNQCKKTTIKQKIQSHKNIKKITKMDFLDDDKIIALIDEQQKFAMNKKQIQVRVKNKGVPKMCLANNKSMSQSTTTTKDNTDNERQTEKELKQAKKTLKEDLKASLLANNVSKDTIDYILDNLKHIKSTIAKNKEVINRSTIDGINRYNPTERAKYGLQLKKQYKKELSIVEKLFYVEPELILTIWAMETNYGTFIGDHPAFNALYSACMNANTMARLHYFEDNIIALAMLVDRGYFSKDVISSFDGGLGGCQFMPDSFYRFAVSMNGNKPDIINNNADVFASIGNYMHSVGWRHGEGVITEIEMPTTIDKCLIGFNTSKTIGEWKKLGIKAHKNGIGADFFENNDAMTSIIITDIDRDDIKQEDKRAFLAYDNLKVILGYNQKLRYGITAGLIFEELRSK